MNPSYEDLLLENTALRERVGEIIRASHCYAIMTRYGVTEQEAELILVLFQARGAIRFRDMDHFFFQDSGRGQYARVVHSVRRKIDHPSILTVPGLGYMLDRGFRSEVGELLRGID